MHNSWSLMAYIPRVGDKVGTELGKGVVQNVTSSEAVVQLDSGKIVRLPFQELTRG